MSTAAPRLETRQVTRTDALLPGGDRHHRRSCRRQVEDSLCAQQRPCLTYRQHGGTPDLPSLTPAVREAFARRPSWRADLRERAAERQWLSLSHRLIYEDVLHGASTG